MKVLNGKVASIAVIVWLSVAAGPAQEIHPTLALPAPSLRAASLSGSPAPQSERTILISLPDHKLALLENGEVKAIYTVAVGKPSTPSPVGHFTVISRIANPTYSHAGRTVRPGPDNPVGTRWMGLSLKGYGIHGTNAPRSIGKSASHGCIRVGQKDLEQLFTMVQVGDAVEITDQRDAQVIAIFGGEAPVLTTAAGSMVAVQTKAPAATAGQQATMQGGE